jgi:hypothetical protein
MRPGGHFDLTDGAGEVRVLAGAKDVVLTLDLGLELTVRVENLGVQGPATPAGTLLVRRGERRLQLSPQGSGSDAYRFLGLRPGDDCTFWIPAQGPQGDRCVYAPGLRPGGEVTVRAVPSRSITGRLKVPAGAQNLQVSASTDDGPGTGGTVKPDGSFEIRGIPEGTTWTVHGHAQSADGASWFMGQATAAAGASVEIELKPPEVPTGK